VPRNVHMNVAGPQPVVEPQADVATDLSAKSSHAGPEKTTVSNWHIFSRSTARIIRSACFVCRFQAPSEAESQSDTEVDGSTTEPTVTTESERRRSAEEMAGLAVLTSVSHPSTSAASASAPGDVFKQNGTGGSRRRGARRRKSTPTRRSPRLKALGG
jgi:hypothetical protein